MLITTLILIMTSLSFTMLICYSPLSLGITILFMSLTLAITFATSMSSWIAFLIFLIYIGGMMVMFAYFLSLIPNQNIPLADHMLTVLMTYILLWLTTIALEMSPPIMMHMSNQLTSFYSLKSSPTLILLAWLLLFTMFLVVKVATHTKGPLRPFQYV